MIHTFCRLVDTPLGRFVCNINDFYVGRSLIFYGEFSALEQAIFAKLVKPADLVIDAGANIGVHSVCFARLATDAGTVLAFEPQEHVFHALCANVFLNSLINVKPFRMALGDKPGSIEVPYLDPRRLNNFGGLQLGGSGTPVPMATIDAFDLPRCDFIKVDVEGMELDVIRGARKTIEKFHPILYAETQMLADPESNLIKMNSLLKELGYDIYIHQPPLFNPRNVNGVEANVLGRDVVSFNVLAMIGTPPEDPYLMQMETYLQIVAPKQCSPQMASAL